MAPLYQFLADVIVQQGDPPAYFLVCLVCRKAVARNSFRGWHSEPIVYEPDPNTGRHFVSLPLSRGGMYQNYAQMPIGYENQPEFSPALRLLVPHSSAKPTGLEAALPMDLQSLKFDIRKEELPIIASGLVNAAISNVFGLQGSASPFSESAHLFSASAAERARNDIEAIGRILSNHHHTPSTLLKFSQGAFRAPVPDEADASMLLLSVRNTAKEYITPSLRRITRLEESFLPANQGAHCAPSVTLADLPIETCCRILDFLEPLYIPGSAIAVHDYIHQRAQLAKLATVSKGFAQVILPILYHHVVLFADPIMLEKLCRALGSYGSYVKRFIIDDVPLGDKYPDVHIRTCIIYIERCLKACDGLVSVECYGDYQLFASSRIPQPSSPTSSASSSRSSTPDSAASVLIDYQVPKTIHSMVIGCPTWLPMDISFELRYVQRHLRELTILSWGSQDILPYVHMKVKLPKLRSLCLKEGLIPEYVVLDLLNTTYHSRENKGGYMRQDQEGDTDDEEITTSNLRELSLLDIKALHGSSILHVLSFRNIGTQLTTLRISLPFNIQRETKDDLPLKILELCPRLEEFAYLSPCSVKVFDVLPKSVRKLELAIFVVPYSRIVTPLDGTVLRYEEFVPFVRNRGVGGPHRGVGSKTGANRPYRTGEGGLEELTIMRRFCHDGSRLGYSLPSGSSVRLNVWQQGLGCRELEEVCREMGVSLKYHAFRMDIALLRGPGF
ncbi:hypothetical protein AX16_007771 [Volvariella volvacea WC 439]|nr:hypothetical protein AX16_007771 [Volvariella volvacea WC 439]